MLWKPPPPPPPGRVTPFFCRQARSAARDPDPPLGETLTPACEVEPPPHAALNRTATAAAVPPSNRTLELTMYSPLDGRRTGNHTRAQGWEGDEGTMRIGCERPDSHGNPRTEGQRLQMV